MKFRFIPAILQGLVIVVNEAAMVRKMGCPLMLLGSTKRFCVLCIPVQEIIAFHRIQAIGSEKVSNQILHVESSMMGTVANDAPSADTQLRDASVDSDTSDEGDFRIFLASLSQSIPKPYYHCNRFFINNSIHPFHYSLSLCTMICQFVQNIPQF